jgi:hypothetical protein
VVGLMVVVQICGLVISHCVANPGSEGNISLGWLFLRIPAPSGCRNLALLPGIPQELRFPGIPDANLVLFDSRNPSRNLDSWQEFLRCTESLVVCD